MAAIAKPDRRQEEYLCTACNMSLVPDIYNRLNVRNEPVVCPNCRRMLYVPTDLSPDKAISARSRGKEKPRQKAAPAAMGRQTSAADVSRSISAAAGGEEEPGEAPPTQTP